MEEFMKLAGVPVHYARPPIAPYGTKGQNRKFYCEKNFLKKLDNCFKELFEVCPLGKPDVITSAGTLVHKPGYHGLGQAFDLDALFWGDKKAFITLNFPSDQKFYLGVEAVIRRHFGTVLNYHYNAAHHDHLHFDDGSTVGFNVASKSKVLFVQSALTHVLAIPIAIDGSYGPQTEGAIKAGLKQLGLAGVLTQVTVWKAFLKAVAEKGFKDVEEKVIKTPLALLSDTFSLIDTHLKGHEAKKTIEGALLAFSAHDDTAKWLKKYE